MTGSISGAISGYKSAQNQYSAMALAYRSWLHSLYAGMVCYMRDPHSSGGISPSMALWLFQTQLMPTATNGMEYNLEEENYALQAAGDIRTQTTGVQNTFNRIIHDIENNISTASIGPHGTHITGPKSLANALSHQLQSLSHMLANPSLALIMGSGNLNDLQGFVNGIERLLSGSGGIQQTVSTIIHSYLTTFVCHKSRVTIFFPPNGRGQPVHISWVTTYNRTIHTTTHVTHEWTGGGAYAVLRRAYSQAATGGQGLPTVFSDIQGNFNNMNQSVSGVSSYIQTQMQYLNQNLQQYFSVYSNFFSDYNTLNSYIVSKSIGS